MSSTNNVQEIIVLEINCIILEMDTQESLQCQVQIITDISTNKMPAIQQDI